MILTGECCTDSSEMLGEVSRGRGVPVGYGWVFDLLEPLQAGSLPIELLNRLISSGEWHHCDKKAHQNAREVQYMAGGEALTKNETGSRLLLGHLKHNIQTNTSYGIGIII
jgi:hypothetical protein